MRRRWAVIAILAAAALGLLAWLLRDPEPTERTATQEQRGSSPARRSIDTAEPEARDRKLRWMKEAASVAGTIRRQGGGPLAGADVCAWIVEGPADLRREPVCTKSGVDGRYLIAELPPVRITVNAAAPEHMPAAFELAPGRQEIELHPGEQRSSVDIELAPGGVAVHGTVEDISGGVVHGALVWSEPSWRSRTARGMAVTHTDDSGAFTLWVAPGTLELRASAEGYANGSADGPAPGYTFEISLTPESVLAGVVTRHGTGEPVADVEVSLRGRQAWNRDRASTTYTDADGRFRFERLEPGRYKPSAQARDGFGLAARSVHLGLGQVVDDVAIELHPAVAVEGRVVIAGQSQRPCVDGDVTLRSPEGSDAMSTIRDDGTVEFLAMLPGKYEVSVSCRDTVARDAYDPIVVAGEPIADRVWEVDAGLAIEGVVVGPDGAAVVRGGVSAQQVDLPPRARPTWGFAEVAGADGRFRIEGLRAGKYQLSPQVRDLELVGSEEPIEVTVAPGSTPEVRIEVFAAGTVEGTVRDREGRPVAGARVELRGTERRGRYDGMTRDDGTFEIRGVDPQAYRAVPSRGWGNTLHAPGTGDDDVQGERVVVRASETATVELVVEDQSGTIRGRVVDEDGSPLNDAFVTASRESDRTGGASGRDGTGGHAWSSGSDPVLTDDEGAFVLDGLEDGRYTVFVSRKGGGEGFLEHVAVGSSGVVVEIAAGGSIAGTVALSGGGEPSRFTIGVEDRALGHRRQEEFYETGGSFTIDELPPGNYEVVADAAEGRAMTTVVLAAGAHETGVELVLASTVTVDGQVLDLDTGEPVSNLTVLVTPRTGRTFSFRGTTSERKYVTDAEGRFTFEDAPAGAVTIVLLGGMQGEIDYGFLRVGAKIPEGVERFTLPTIEIPKARTGKRQQAGDLGFTTKQARPDADFTKVPHEVAFIRPGGPAAATDLAVGDVIVKVDGHDVTGDFAGRYQPLTRVPPGTSVALGLADGRSVTIVAGAPP